MMQRKIGLVWLAGVVLAAAGVTTAGAQEQAAVPVSAAHRFRVTIDGFDAGLVQTVEGIGVYLEVIEEPPGAGDRVVRKRAGRIKYSNITLKRPFTPGSTFFKFLDGVRRGGDPDVRRDVSITILDVAGHEVERFDYAQCFLSAYSLTPLGASATLDERVSFACDFIRQS